METSLPRTVELALLPSPGVYEFAIDHPAYNEIYLAVHNASCEPAAVHLVQQLVNDLANGRVRLVLGDDDAADSSSGMCDHPWHRNPGLETPCPQCGAGEEGR
jgi:hypothetical protein